MNKVLEVCLANKWLKLLSLALAVVIWVYVSRKAYGTKDVVDVPLVLTGYGENFILAQSWEKVTLSLRGPAGAMDQLRTDVLVAELNIELKGKLPNMSEAKQPVSVEIPVAGSDIRNLPDSVTVAELRPRKVRVRLDQIVEKRLTVVVDETVLIGKVKKGLRLLKSYPSKKHVMVTGPKSVLDRMETIRPRPFEIEDLEVSTQQPRRLDTRAEINGKQIDCLKPEPARIEVWIDIEPIGKTLKIKDVPIEIHGLPGFVYTVLDEKKANPYVKIPEVEIQGPEKLLEKPMLRAFIDLTAMQEPEQTVRVQFSVAEKIEVRTKAPDVVVVRTKAEKSG